MVDAYGVSGSTPTQLGNSSFNVSLGHEEQQDLSLDVSSLLSEPKIIDTRPCQRNIGKFGIRACDICHRRKVKCDNVQPACSQCVKFSAQCTYNSILGPRKKITRRRPKRMDDVENRLHQLEDSLRREPGSNPTRGQIPTLSHFPGFSAPQDSSKLPINAHETGIPAPFQYATYEAIRSNNSATEYDTMPLLGIKLQGWVPEPYRIPSNPSREHRQLGNKIRRQEVVPLIEAYFDTFNRTTPLFDQDSFMHRFSMLDMGQIHNDAALWTAMIVMCALACRYRAMLSQPGDNDREAWRYLQMALEKVVELTVCDPDDLLAIQALLGMAIVLHSTPDSNPASTLVGAAVRLIHRDGLHIQRRGSESCQVENFWDSREQNAVEDSFIDIIERQRNRVFWIAYGLDLDLSFRLNRPPLIQEDDIDVPLPAYCPGDWLGHIYTTDGTFSFNYFRLRAVLALIQGRIHQRLYTVRALRQPEPFRQQAIEELGAELCQWLSSSGGLGNRIEAHLESGDLGVVFSEPSIFVLRLLHLKYLNCLARIHGFSFQNVHSQGLLGLELVPVMRQSPCNFSPLTPLGAPLVGPPNYCVCAARVCLRLLQLYPGKDHACNWTILNHYVSAVAILLVHATGDPWNSSSLDDLYLATPVLGLLQRFEGMSKSSDITWARQNCMEMVSNARLIIMNSAHKKR